MSVFNVSNSAELSAALGAATGGDEIRLASGDYGQLSLNSGDSFSSEITITSADPNAPASFSKLRVDGASNVTFDSILFDYTFSSGERDTYEPFAVKNSDHIKFVNSVFDGDVTQGVSTLLDGTGTGRALAIRNSTSIEVSNNEVFDFWKGISGTTVTDFVVAGNDLHAIRADGMVFGNVHNMVLENNYLHDFVAAIGVSDHRDMIQFGKSVQHGQASSDVVIRNNVFDMGTGDHGQTLFMGNNSVDPNDTSMFYQNILIENNIIYNAHVNGLVVAEADGLIIRDNTVVAIDRGETKGIAVPVISVSHFSQNVVIENNVTPDVRGYNGQSNWTLSNNVLIQNTDPNAPGYYDDVFVYHATGQADGYNQWGVKPGGEIEAAGAGSSLVDFYPLPYDAWPANWGSSVTSAGATSGTGTTTGAGTTPTDTGTTPADTGTTPADTGTAPADTGTAPADTGTSGSSDGAMIFDDYSLDIAGLPGNNQATLKGDTQVIDYGTHSVLSFDGDKDNAKLGRLTQFEQSEQLAFTVDFARHTADGSEQRLIWNHKKMALTLTDDGLIAHVANTTGKFHKGFEVSNIGLNDTEVHQISLLVDQATDRLQVIVDDVLVLDETGTDFDFVGAGGREWGWNIGTGWGRYVDGEVSNFQIDDEVQFIEDQTVLGDTFFG
jgi:Right handed beta helix region